MRLFVQMAPLKWWWIHFPDGLPDEVRFELACLCLIVCFFCANFSMSVCSVLVWLQQIFVSKNMMTERWWMWLRVTVTSATNCFKHVAPFFQLKKKKKKNLSLKNEKRKWAALDTGTGLQNKIEQINFRHLFCENHRNSAFYSWALHINTPLITLSVWVRELLSLKRVTAIITAISWQPTSLCSVSETANRVNMKEMNGLLQGTTWI